MIKYVVASFGFTVKYVDNEMWSNRVVDDCRCQLFSKFIAISVYFYSSCNLIAHIEH